MAFSHDGSRIASGSSDKSVRVYDERGHDPSWTLMLLLSSNRSLSFLNAAITDVRASAANKIVLEQHGAASGSPGNVEAASGAVGVNGNAESSTAVVWGDDLVGHGMHYDPILVLDAYLLWVLQQLQSTGKRLSLTLLQRSLTYWLRVLVIPKSDVKAAAVSTSTSA